MYIACCFYHLCSLRVSVIHVDSISMFVGHIGSLRYPYYFFYFTIFLLESQQRENKEEHANSQNSKITERN